MIYNNSMIMANSTQEKLAKLFPELFQVRRLTKQITDIKQLREKGSFDIKMSILKDQSLNFRIQILPPAYKSTKLPENLTKLPQEVKIIVRNTYPAHPPKLFFMHNNMTKYGLKPFRDYCLQVLQDTKWLVGNTIIQLIKNLPIFLQRCHHNKNQILLSKPPTLEQHFEIDNLYSWKFCQVHPVRLFKRNITKQGFIYIDVTASEIVILQEVGMQATFLSCDFIQGQDIQNIYKRKNTSNKFLLELKLSYPGLSGKFGIQFSSQDHQALIIAMMQCARISEDSRKKSDSQTKATQSSSSQSEKQIQKDGFKIKRDLFLAINLPIQVQLEESKLKYDDTVSIREIIQEIAIYQSLVENKMTSQNINQLVTLLQQAIQYYSAENDERYTIYLNKMHAILSNQMAQALFQSINEEKKSIKKGKENIGKKQQYQSIVDLL